MSAIATIVSILNGLWTLVGNLFGLNKKPADENTQAVEVANKAGELSADQARATRAQTDQEVAANATQTETDIAAVHDAGSVRDGSNVVNQAIARSRAHPGADS